MRKRTALPGLCGLAALLTAAILGYALYNIAEEVTNPQAVDRAPRIFPDYSDTVIPPNIAPLNFVVKEPGEKYDVRIEAPNATALHISSRSPAVVIPAAKWRGLLEANRGGRLTFGVSVKGQDGRWRSFEPIVNRIAHEEIDRFLVYRVLPKFNRTYADISLRQRDLQSFDESVLLHSKSFNNGCMNCHAFSGNSPSLMVMHVRSPGGGMLLIRDGTVTKVDTRTGFNPTPAKYISLHPSGKLAAFSETKLVQFFHAVGEWVDVFDVQSDLGLYLFDTNTVTTTPDICKPDRQETYPSWSPDGRYLYYCSAPDLPADRWRQVRYDLMRIAYDVETGTWGKPETVLSADQTGLSITLPRISPDGRFIVFCMSEYGNWPVCQVSADLYLMDLTTGKYGPLDINSDQSESWHCWSSNSRWIVFSSRRYDATLAKPYFSYIDETGKAFKPLLLPQKDPTFYESFLKTYNLPELITEPFPLTQRDLLRALRSGPVLKAKLDPKVEPRAAPRKDTGYEPAGIE